jgi:hypothetical protein
MVNPFEHSNAKFQDLLGDFEAWVAALPAPFQHQGHLFVGAFTRFFQTWDRVNEHALHTFEAVRRHLEMQQLLHGHLPLSSDPTAMPADKDVLD